MTGATFNSIAKFLDSQNVIKIVSWMLTSQSEQIVLQVIVSVRLELSKEYDVFIIIKGEVET